MRSGGVPPDESEVQESSEARAPTRVGKGTPVLTVVTNVEWRAVNAPHLVALVRNGAVFKKGKLVERSTARGLTETAA
jgi:preprotein translocase subunit SecA